MTFDLGSLNPECWRKAHFLLSEPFSLRFSTAFEALDKNRIQSFWIRRFFWEDSSVKEFRTLFVEEFECAKREFIWHCSFRGELELLTERWLGARLDAWLEPAIWTLLKHEEAKRATQYYCDSKKSHTGKRTTQCRNAVHCINADPASRLHPALLRHHSELEFAKFRFSISRLAMKNHSSALLRSRATYVIEENFAVFTRRLVQCTSLLRNSKSARSKKNVND